MRLPTGPYSFECSYKTHDGGIVIGGLGRDKLAGPPYFFKPILTKFDSLGNHLWSKELSDATDIASIYELSDGSLIITARYSNPQDPGFASRNMYIAKLTATGDVIWFKTFRTLLSSSNNCSDHIVSDIKTAEGVNGEILFTGTDWHCVWPHRLVVFKLNNNGNLLWEWAYRGWMANSYGVGIFYENNEVTVINKESQTASGGDNVIHYDFMKLNYSTGALISQRSWKINLQYPVSFNYSFTNDVSAIKLANGNYCIYGVTFGEWDILPANQPRFSLLEFNSAYDYVKGYTINSSLETNVYEARINVNRFAQVVYVLTELLTYPDKNKYIGVVQDGLLLNQRKREYRNKEIFYDNFQSFDDGSFAFIGNEATVGQSNFYLNYSLLHTSDTGSACLGPSVDVAWTKPVQYVPYQFTWDSVFTDPLLETSNGGISTSSLVYTGTPGCDQKAICDTVKIHGLTSSCDLQQNLIFTAYKRKECGARVNWQLDPGVVQSMQLVNDTTVSIRLNQPWQGWLYAFINTSCGVKKDSVLISFMPSPGTVSLGVDTVICPGSSVLLNARKGYASYLWSNGSTDSTLLVSTPGIYYVDVTDACNNTFSDTINVMPAPPVPFSLGVDREKCNNDTLHLTASAGFLNYSWSPAYNISSQTAQEVIVQPAVDTAYFVRAEKTPGCFAYDTIRIKVNRSLPLDLGTDKSFCSGDSAVLDAGPGFSKYLWSNGDTTHNTTVRAATRYTVIATTAMVVSRTIRFKY